MNTPRPDKSLPPASLQSGPEFRPTQRFARWSALALGCLTTVASSQAGLIFNFNPAAGTSAQAIAGFQAAGNRWSALFDDNVTVNINIAFLALAPNVLGSASSTQSNYSYANVRTALGGDQTSGDDATAVANLNPGNAFNLIMNRTSDNPNGSGSAGLFVDNNGSNNNSQIRMSNANAKALGLLAGNAAAVDASISFSNAFTWDFDPTDGITAGAFDFVGVATHEIGHAMGFISGVDILDINSPPVNGPFLSNQFTFVSTLDLYRHTATSEFNNAIDWAADTRDKFFSIDGGATLGPRFSTGRNFGDGQQASHWKDSLGIGIMDPTFGTGELGVISGNDIRAFDVIGWNLAQTPSVPDATSSLALVGFGCIALLGLRRGHRRNS